MTGLGWLVRRLLGAVIVWMLVSFLSFSLGSLAPGDPAYMILLRRTSDPPAESEVQQLRRELMLDRPVMVRYGRWLSAAVRGDFGNSYRTGQPVFRELRERFPATLVLAITALLVGLVLAIPIAVAAVAVRDTPFDHGARLLAIAGVSVPGYLIGYLLILLFAVTVHLLPTSGADGWRHLILPAVTLGLGGAASMTRLLRASLLDEMGAPYVRSGRAKGLSALAVLTRHALRNALNPLVTLSALRFGRLLGETVIVETVFGWPGVGQWMMLSIYDRDYPAIQGFVLYIATIFVIISLAVDLSYPLLDPRVRPGARTAGA